MKLQSGLFSSLARALPQSLLEGGDAVLSFPQLIVPGVEPQYIHDPHEQVAAGATFGQVSNSSFVQSVHINRAAAAALQDTDIFALSAGMWRLTFDWHLLLPGVFASCFCFIAIQKDDFSLGFQTLNLWSFRAGAGIFRSDFRQSHTVAIPTGLVWKFTIEVDNTGAATETDINGFMNCKRIA